MTVPSEKDCNVRGAAKQHAGLEKEFRMQRLCKQPFFLRTATTITATMPQAWGNMNVGTCGHPCIVRNAANAETANIYASLVRFLCEALEACNFNESFINGPDCATAALRTLWATSLDERLAITRQVSLWLVVHMSGCPDVVYIYIKCIFVGN